jgi:hypothetical protein
VSHTYALGCQQLITLMQTGKTAVIKTTAHA